MSKQDKFQLKLIWGINFVIVTVLWLIFMLYTHNVIFAAPVAHAESASGYEYTCPDGQYPIGDGVCKNEPTGCPYGDSIPLDSPKCAPPSDPENAYAPYQPPTSTNTQPTSQSTPKAPKTGNNDYSGGGAGSSFDVSDAQASETSSEPEKTTEKDEPKTEDQQTKSNTPIYVLLLAMVGLVSGGAFRLWQMLKKH